MENIILDVDSYKVSHWKQYVPGAKSMFSYIESRGGLFGETVFFGLQYLLKRYLEGSVVSVDDVEEAAKFYEGHGVPFNQDGWMRIARDLGGKIPVRIRAVPEGLIVPNHNALVTVKSTDPETFWVASWLETMLVRLWYPINVCTISYNVRKLIKNFLDETCDNPEGELLFKLHDFGSRGVSSQESAAIGGAAHLVNFMGSDTVAGVRLANKYYNCSMAGFSIPACYDEKTEILTENGFLPFTDLDEQTKIGQYTKEGTIEFVNHQGIHSSPNYNGSMITFSTKGKTAKIDLVVTPNHRMVRRSEKTGKIEIQEASNSSFSHRNVIPQAGLGVGSCSEFTPLDALKIAFQADGSFVSRKEHYTGERVGTRPIRFSLKKKRKIERLRLILNKLGYDYLECPAKSRPGYIYFWVKTPLDVYFVKDLSWIKISSLSSEWCKKAVEEFSLWDGQRKFDTFMYHNSDYFSASIVQCVGILAGFRSSLQEYDDPRGNRKVQYTVLMCSSFNSRRGPGIKKNTINYSGNVYCVTVPSGMVVVRRNGIVVISGNSEHSTITSWGRLNEAKAYKNMLDQYAKPGGIVAVVSDSYDIYNACENIWGGILKDDVVNSGATVVIRPDSGDPPTVVLKVLNILEDKFGVKINSKGYKVLNNVRVIQGDGVNLGSIEKILRLIRDHKYSAENVAFGMGGALLQQHDRDTQRFAMKCSSIGLEDGTEIDVYKQPVTDVVKNSKRGRLDLVRRQVIGSRHGPGCKMLKTVKLEPGVSHEPDSVMETVFENGELLVNHSFDDIRKRVWG